LGGKGVGKGRSGIEGSFQACSTARLIKPDHDGKRLHTVASKNSMATLAHHQCLDKTRPTALQSFSSFTGRTSTLTTSLSPWPAKDVRNGKFPSRLELRKRIWKFQGTGLLFATRNGTQTNSEKTCCGDVKKLCHELELSLRAAFFIHFGNLRY
jgi:hypothetical protein